MLLFRRAAQSLVFRNTLILTLSQISSYIVPLITVPYTARVLGVDEFGYLGVASSIAANLATLADWGFSFSSTREVAREVDNPERLRLIFWDTMSAKIMLGIVTLVITLVSMCYIGLGTTLSWVILTAWLQVVGTIISVNFFLQGIEAMGSMVVAGLVGRLIAVPLTFIFVMGPSDTIWAVGIAGLGGLVSGMASLVVAWRSKPLSPVILTMTGAKRQILSGWHLFVSNSAVNLYSQINVIVVGAIAGPGPAGLLFGAEKLQRAAKSLCGPLGMAVYPRINYLLAANPGHAVQMMVRLLAFQGLFSFGLFIVILAGAPYITVLFLGHSYVDAIPSVRLLSTTVLFVGVNGVLGVQVMLPFGMQRSFMGILVGAGLFNVVTIGPLTYLGGATGAALSIALTEFIVTVMMGFVVWRSKVLVKPPSDDVQLTVGAAGE